MISQRHLSKMADWEWSSHATRRTRQTRSFPQLSSTHRVQIVGLKCNIRGSKRQIVRVLGRRKRKFPCWTTKTYTFGLPRTSCLLVLCNVYLSCIFRGHSKNAARHKLSDCIVRVDKMWIPMCRYGDLFDMWKTISQSNS